MGNFLSWDGVLLPERERLMWGWIVPRMLNHPDERIKGYPSYQRNKYDIAKKYVKDFNHALDIGAHCGFWSMAMSQDFKKVTAFEPVSENRKAYIFNLGLVDDGSCEVELYGYAVGDHSGWVSMSYNEDSTANSQVITGTDVPIMALDSMKFDHVSFVKIDVDGYEYNVLKGMKGILQTHKPTVIVEAKSGWGERYDIPDNVSIEFLKDLGYVVREELREDFILTCE